MMLPLESEVVIFIEEIGAVEGGFLTPAIFNLIVLPPTNPWL